MKNMTIKIALAALIHDIGKFVDTQTLDVNEEQLKKYLPVQNGIHFNYHAALTAARKVTPVLASAVVMSKSC